MAVPGIIPIISYGLELANKIWDAFSPQRKLKRQIVKLEKEISEAQVKGDLDELRKKRALLDDVRRRLDTGDY